MKAKKLGLISIALAIIVPSLVMATVVISYNFPTNTVGVNPEIYLTEGPNYAPANAMGLVYAKGAAGPIPSGTTIDINTTSGSAYTALVNVFLIVNNTPTNNGPVYVTLFAPNPTNGGITMYASTSELTVSNTTNGISISGTQVSTSGTYFHLTSAGNALYIGFILTGSASGSSEIVINYQIS